MQFVVDDLQNGYVDIVATVCEQGTPVAPRGQATREVLGATIVLTDPRRSLPIGVGRKLNPAIAAVEALQLIGGVSHPELMVRVAKNFDQFRDGGAFHGAYGPRIRAQLPRAVDRLLLDPDTRQAVVTIWDPALDAHVEGLHDYPCTIALQWMIRDGKLDAHTFMRSNDVWWGLAYDAFQFCQLQFTVAHALRLPVGTYYHHANSLHVYERDFAAIENLRQRTEPELENDTWGVNGMTWARLDWAMEQARDLLKGKGDHSFHGERWYLDTLEPYL